MRWFLRDEGVELRDRDKIGSRGGVCANVKCVRGGGGNSTTTMKTMFVGSEESIVVDWGGMTVIGGQGGG